MPRRSKSNGDGRANNGGARQGTPGNAYPNRSDLRTQKIQVPPSKEYGQGERLRAAQQTVPMAGTPSAPPTAGAGGAAPVYSRPSDTPNLTDPTQRPNEPLTAGLPFGAGPGPEAMGPPPMSDVEARLRALYAVHPTTELRELIRMQELME